MFCSKCGKTLDPSWTKCKYCQTPVGENRFDGVPYTSTQPSIAPGAAAPYEGRAYTRTTYTGGDYEEQYDGDVDVATSYRPVYDYHSVPDAQREEMMQAIREPEEEAEPEQAAPAQEAPAPQQQEPALDISDIEGFDISRIKARPIVAQKPAGYSSDVEEYVRRLEQDDVERPARRGKHISPDDPYRDEPTSDGPEMTAEDVDDDEGYDDRPSGPSRYVKIAVALVVVAALFVVGVYVAPKLLGKFQKEAAAPIEGVTVDLYNQGVALLQNHVGQEYRDSVLATYQNGGFVALTTRLNADKAEISALLPAQPNTNDQLFLDAVGAIQEDIGSALTLDAVEISSEGAVTSQDSAQRWTTINDLVNGFGSVSSAQGLSAIVAGERIVAELPTPTPEPAVTQGILTPEYATLSKGDKSEDVQKMQERLWELGFLDDDRDGNFGSNTQTAVKLFQQAAGLDVTGVADNATLTLLYSADAPMTENANITPAPAETPAVQDGAIDPVQQEPADTAAAGDAI